MKGVLIGIYSGSICINSGVVQALFLIFNIGIADEVSSCGAIFANEKTSLTIVNLIEYNKTTLTVDLENYKIYFELNTNASKTKLFAINHYECIPSS